MKEVKYQYGVSSREMNGEKAVKDSGTELWRGKGVPGKLYSGHVVTSRKNVLCYQSSAFNKLDINRYTSHPFFCVYHPLPHPQPLWPFLLAR